MTRVFVFVFVLSIGLFSQSASAQPTPPPIDVEVYFTNNDYTPRPHMYETHAERTLLALIGNADTSIHAALHTLDRPSIAYALKNAKDRGVEVLVVGDGDNALEPRYAPYFSIVERAGIPISYRYSSNAIMHNKYMVFDGSVVWTGTGNFTVTGFSYNDNTWLTINDNRVAADYLADFEQMFAGDFGPDKTNAGQCHDYAGGERLCTSFSPSDTPTVAESGAQGEIISLFDSATVNAVFGTFYWTQYAVADAAINASGRGVDVFGTFDATGASNRYSEDETLCDAGILVRTEFWGGKQHNKTLSIDNGSAFLLGSQNWTRSAHERNDENTVIVHGADIGQLVHDNLVESFYDLPEDITECRHVNAESQVPACNDGLDNNYNGRRDHEEAQCWEVSLRDCTDGADNDYDGYIDTQDWDCRLVLSGYKPYKVIAGYDEYIHWQGGGLEPTHIYSVGEIQGQGVLIATTYSDMFTFDELPPYFDLCMGTDFCQRFSRFDFDLGMPAPAPTPLPPTPVTPFPTIHPIGTFTPLPPVFNTPEPTATPEGGN